MSGTSMAAPHAAGAAALHLEAYPGASPSQVLDALRARATRGVVSGAQSRNDHLLHTLRGFKVKGRHHVDLEWSGAEGARVRVLLAEELLDVVENGGAYTYGNDNRGKGTYTFQVCEEEVDRCSEVKTLDM